MKYSTCSRTEETIKLSREQAIQKLEDNTASRIDLEENKISASVDNFYCPPYRQFQVFNHKIHCIGSFNSSSEAIEFAENSILEQE